MPGESRIQTVVLTVQYSTRSSYYVDWLDAFWNAAQFQVTPFNLFRRQAGGTASRADQKRPADWESSVMAEWDKERQDKEWRDLRSLKRR